MDLTVFFLLSYKQQEVWWPHCSQWVSNRPGP